MLGGQNAQFCLEEYARGAVGTMPACEFADLLAPVLALVRRAGGSTRRGPGSAVCSRSCCIGLQGGIAWAVHKEVLVARGIIDHAVVRSPANPLRRRGHRLLNETGPAADHR